MDWNGSRAVDQFGDSMTGSAQVTGRIVRVVSGRLWLVGMPILVALFVWKPSPLPLIVAVVAAPGVWSTLRGKSDACRSTAPLSVKLAHGSGAHLALTLGLAVITVEIHNHLDVTF
jgi:hypothetical protein